MGYFQVSRLRMAVDQMTLGEIRAFDIDPSKRGTCPIYQQKTYYVKKEFCDHSETYCGSGEVNCVGYIGRVNFFASTSYKFEKSSNTMADRFKGQLGYVRCRKGYIDNVWVNDENYDNPARGCGIATVFTSLCMVDPELNFLTHSELKKFFHGKHATQFVSEIKKDCRKFMGLLMEADPLTGAYSYFSAAKKSGYTKMLIFDTFLGTFEPFWMSVLDAEKQYDASTGMIGGIMGKEKEWWFCNEFEG